MEPVAASTAYLLISHGSRDPRPQEAMNQLAELVRQRLNEAFHTGDVKSGELHSCGNVQGVDMAGVYGKSSYEQHHYAGFGHKDLQVHTNNEVSHANAMTAALPSYGQRTWVLSQAQISDRKGQQSLKSERKATRLDGSGSGGISPGVIVGTACLELSVMPLREQIYEFGCRLIAAGVRELKLLPVFLMAGVHVMEDIPTEIEAARHQLGDDIQLTVCEHLGSHPRLLAILEKRLAAVPAESSILVAHGSRRPKGNKGVEKLARLLNTQVAYWAVPPDIETQVIELMQQGCQRLTILPYFLFAGGITDAITHRTEELAERFPKVQFRLLPTLGATAEIAKLSVEMMQSA